MGYYIFKEERPRKGYVKIWKGIWESLWVNLSKIFVWNFKKESMNICILSNTR